MVQSAGIKILMQATCGRNPRGGNENWQNQLVIQMSMKRSSVKACPGTRPSFREAFWVWVKVALNSFGGPVGQIAVMHRYLVEEKRWISESRFLHALNYCMLLPGPEAQQLAIYIGWLLHKIPGGIVAGTLFVIPGFIAMLILSILYAGYQNLSIVQWIFFGLKPAVLAVVIEAVVRIGKRVLKNRLTVTLAGLSFVGIFFFDVPFPLIVVSAGIIGYVGGRVSPMLFEVNQGHVANADPCDSPIARCDDWQHIRRNTCGPLPQELLQWLSPGQSCGSVP